MSISFCKKKQSLRFAVSAGRFLLILGVIYRSQFDEDVRGLVQIKLVHGSWKKEDTNKMRIDEALRRYSNVQSITAHMPEAFGTHHSKMIVLFRRDDQAQYIFLIPSKKKLHFLLTVTG